MDRYVWVNDDQVLNPADYGLESHGQVYNSIGMGEETMEQILEEDGHTVEDFKGYKLKALGEGFEVEIEELVTEQSGLTDW